MALFALALPAAGCATLPAGLQGTPSRAIVRVRLLMDDLYTTGEDELLLGLADSLKRQGTDRLALDDRGSLVWTGSNDDGTTTRRTQEPDASLGNA